MVNDLFGGLGGLMKGLGIFMSQDDLDTRLFAANSELYELQLEESEIYAAIGKRAFKDLRDNPAYSDLAYELQLAQKKLGQVQEIIRTTHMQKEEHQNQQAAQLAARTCFKCGTENPDGTKFCQQCGAKLGEQADAACTKCGTYNQPYTNFRGGCGAKL